MKYAHSIECWDNNKLVGGIYGLAIGGIFFAESMFSCVPNGSKVALINLVARLWKTGFKILDVQFLNEHLIQFGAYEITKSKFKKNLEDSIQLKIDFYSLASTDDDFFDSLSTFLQTRIETS
jgi:leucyl/phenylalanyl-tRNA--protein transferase